MVHSRSPTRPDPRNLVAGTGGVKIRRTVTLGQRHSRTAGASIALPAARVSFA
jgi:hypothetical protein